MKTSLPLLAVLGVVQSQRVELVDPISRYSDLELELPPPGFPILQTDFTTQPDCGETSYVGHGRLQGLNALITGGDSGIGRATAIAFAREGANVAINYLPDEEPDAQALADLLAQEDLTITRIPGDLTDEAFCTSLVDEAASVLGGLDILIGNAGYSSLRNNQQLVTNYSSAEVERVFRTNVFANLWLAGAAVPHLPRGGSIVFTASGQAASPDSRTVDYGASKAAITHITRSLALQLAPNGIRVNAVAPGFTFTPFLATMGILTEQMEMVVNATVYGRMLQPGEIGPLYVDAVDPLKTAVSGEVFTGAATDIGP